MSEHIWKTSKSVSALTGCSHTPHSHRRLGLAQISTDTRAPARLLSTDRHSQSSCHKPAPNQERNWRGDAVSSLPLCPGYTPPGISLPKQDLLFLTKTVPANTLLLPKLLHTQGPGQHLRYFNMKGRYIKVRNCEIFFQGSKI